MTTTVTPQPDSKLIATWKKAVALPIAAFFGIGSFTSISAELLGNALLFLAFALMPVLYLLAVRRNTLKRRNAAAMPDAQVSVGRNWLLLGIPTVAVLLIAGMLNGHELTPDPNALVPNVIGTSLSDAREALRDVGLEVKMEDDTGRGRGVWNLGNWTATRQSPEAGIPIGDTRAVVLGAVKEGEKTAAQQAAEEAAEPTPTSTAPEASSATQSPAPAATPERLPAEPAPLTDEEQRQIEDAAHITNLKMGGVYFGGDEAAATRSGRVTCQYIDNATDPSLAILQAVRTAQKAGYSRRDAEYLVGSAVGAYCDQYMYLIPK